MILRSTGNVCCNEAGTRPSLSTQEGHKEAFEVVLIVGGHYQLGETFTRIGVATVSGGCIRLWTKNLPACRKEAPEVEDEEGGVSLCSREGFRKLQESLEMKDWSWNSI